MTAAGNTFVAALRREMLLQLRSGLSALYLGMPILWIILIRAVPENAKSIVAVTGVVADPVLMGTIFVGALQARERDQGLFSALAVTPLNSRTWLAARVLLIGCQGALGALILALGSGLAFAPALLVSATIPAAACGALIGLALARPFRDMANFFIVGGIASSVVSAPGFVWYGAFEGPWWLLGPSYPSLAAVGRAFGRSAGSPGGWLMVLCLILWSLVGFVLVARLYERGLFRKIGVHQ